MNLMPMKRQKVNLWGPQKGHTEKKRNQLPAETLKGQCTPRDLEQVKAEKQQDMLRCKQTKLASIGPLGT